VQFQIDPATEVGEKIIMCKNDETESIADPIIMKLLVNPIQKSQLSYNLFFKGPTAKSKFNQFEFHHTLDPQK
jgi:hypothetical protein